MDWNDLVGRAAGVAYLVILPLLGLWKLYELLSGFLHHLRWVS